MRHRKKDIKLGRATQHRAQMLANLVCSLIKHGRVRTTLPKARATAALADHMVTLAKKGLAKTSAVHHRRLAVARLHQEDAVKMLFGTIAPRSTSRNGGYTRVVRLGVRIGDAATTAFVEWVDGVAPAEAGDAEKAKKEKTTPQKTEKPATQVDAPPAGK